MEKISKFDVGDLVLIGDHPHTEPAIILKMGPAWEDKQTIMFPVCHILNLRTSAVERSYLFRLRLLSAS
jgi:hypothetical protein